MVTAMKTEHYIVSGMICSSCSVILERIAERIPGVTSAKVNYMTDTMVLNYEEGSFSHEQLERKAIQAGFRLTPREAADATESRRLRLQRKKSLRIRIYLAFTASVILNSFPSLPSPVQLALAVVVQAIVAAEFMRDAVNGLENRTGNMSMLVFVSTNVAFLYSLFAILFPEEGAIPCLPNIAAVVMMILIGRFIELGSRMENTELLERLRRRKSLSVRVLSNEKVEQLPLGEVRPGMHLLIKGGERIPIDGVVISGSLSVDESIVTGEFYPMRREAGDKVIGSSLVIRGNATIEASVAPENDTFTRLIDSALDSVNGKRVGYIDLVEKVMRYFVPSVFILSAAAALAWYGYFSPGNLDKAVRCAVAIMMVACPCAMSLAVPLAVTGAVSCCLKNGIFVCDEGKLDKLRNVDVVVFDKTGTIMKKQMKLSRVIINGKGSTSDILPILGGLSSLAPDPAFEAIAVAAKGFPVLSGSSTLLMEQSGGIKAIISGTEVCAGTRDFIESLGITPAKLPPDAPGHAVFFLIGETSGVVQLEEEFRDDAIECFSRLAGMGKKIYILSGDRSENLLTLKRLPGVIAVEGGLGPEDKKVYIEKLKGTGTVMMVGDGLNDMPGALSADLTVTLGDSCDALQSAADIIAGRSKLMDLPRLVMLSEQMHKNMRQNLLLSATYNFIGLILAGAGIITPLTAGFAMSISSVIVVLNASRLKKAAKLWEQG